MRSEILTKLPLRRASLILSVLTGLDVCSGQVNVLTYHNNNARTGQNLRETILNHANVRPSTFGRLFTVPLDGKADGQPLYVSGLAISGRGSYDVVFAATEHDSVYAFDANNGSVYWRVSLLKAGEMPSDARGCDQVTPEIGVTSTPVIDLTAGPHGTIYLVAMSKDSSGNYYQRLHALDIATGAEEFGGPITVQASYPGTGANSNNGRVVFDPKQYKARPGLLLLHGVVYTSWGSHCDIGSYTGWIIGYDKLSLLQTSVFNFAPNGSDAALWNSGGAPAADAQGNIFVSVANGTFDTQLNAQGLPSRGDYGNAFVKLTTNNRQLNATDYWTMSNSNYESGNDVDLGSGGIMLLPDLRDSSGTVQHLAVGAGKDANLYVVNRDNMGKYDPNSDATIYQQMTGALPGGIWSNPAYFNGYVYFGPQGSPLQAFSTGNARLSPAMSTSRSFPYPGVTPSISANGSANALLWAIESNYPAILRAYDAENLAVEYFSSNQLGPSNKYVTPTVANGQVFVGTTDSVVAFGLLPEAAVADGTYSIINQMSTLVLEDPQSSSASGVQIIEYTPQGAANQKWVFTAKGNGYYTIRSASSGLYLTDPGSKSNQAKLEQQTGNGSAFQLWSLSASGSGYVIRSKATGWAIDNWGFSLKPGTGMHLWPPTGNSNQAWLIQ